MQWTSMEEKGSVNCGAVVIDSASIAGYQLGNTPRLRGLGQPTHYYIRLRTLCLVLPQCNFASAKLTVVFSCLH